MMYHVPLASGYWKLFSRPYDSFWCCQGTGIESFSKLNDSIYFHDDLGIWLNLFISSDLNWAEKGIKLRQQTRFPEEQGSTVLMTLAQPTRFELRIRVPSWIERDFKVHINGSPVEAAFRPSSYFVLDRLWRNGDKVEISLPMDLHTETMPDDKNLQSILYGPLVLAGDLGVAGLTPDSYRGTLADPVKNHVVQGEPVPAPELRSGGEPLSKWIKRDPAVPLRFRAASSSGDVPLLPLNRIVKQRYATYWRVS